MPVSNRGQSILWAFVLLAGTGPAPADGAPPAPGSAAPADATQPSPPSTDRERTAADKAALAKQRMQRCRLHPGTCAQGTQHAVPADQGRKSAKKGAGKAADETDETAPAPSPNKNPRE